MSRRRSIVPALALVTIFLALTGATSRAQDPVPPPPPDQCRAIPDYGDLSIIVEWNDVEGEIGYRVFRAEAVEGPFEQLGADLPPDTVTLLDPGRVAGAEYFYLVRAFNDDGESPDSNIFQQNVNVVWPNPGNHSLLHNWNELIGSAATDGYHRGCDIQQVGPDANPIVVPRGGVVARVGNTANDNNHIYVEVKIGEEYRYDSFNHLEGRKVAYVGYDVGDYVRAGDPLPVIGTDYFYPKGESFIDHVHFFVPSDPWTGEVDGRHPLLIFGADEERDPGVVRPAVHDHGMLSDGPVIFHRQGAAPGPPYLDLPLGDDPSTPDEDEGDVDLHVEIADLAMGLGTTHVPTSISWWIEGRPCDGRPPVLGSPAAPYVLVKWDETHFRGSGTFWWHIADQAQDLAPFISYDGVAYPTGWHNFKHFILTNTAHGDGAPEHVDESQYWNTNALDEGAPVDGPGANHAGTPDAVRAADARFPDGSYTVHVLATDLLGDAQATIEGVALENFPPAVASAGSDGTASIDFLFSEPMESVAVESAIELWRAGAGPVGYAVVWDAFGCAMSLVLDEPMDACAQYEVTLDAGIAVDLNGRGLDSEFGSSRHDGIAAGAPWDSVRVLHSTDGVVEVTAVRVDKQEPGIASIGWATAPGADVYAVSRGDLASLAAGDYGACLAADLATTDHQDLEIPAAGAGWFYLVQGWNPVCGAGPLGRDSTGADRVDTGADSCW